LVATFSLLIASSSTFPFHYISRDCNDINCLYMLQ
jgi:hypothetical protein